MTLLYERAGHGEPLLLVHGLGAHKRFWDPVREHLEGERDVVAIDLPGFGGSPALPAGRTPSPAALARHVAAFLDELGWDAPHVAGNSLGGWIALELGRLRRARSVLAYSPAGFWTDAEARYALWSLTVSRAAGRLLGDRVERVVAPPWVRRAAFAQLASHGERLDARAAAEALRNLATSPGFAATRDAMLGRFEGGDDLTMPVTIAWGERDRLLPPRQARRARAQLPRARHLLLSGCGHVPTSRDGAQVARAILTSG